MINFKQMEQDILTKSYAEIFEEYLHRFKTEINIPTRVVSEKTIGLRGRKNCDTFKVSFDDYDTEIEVPYFKKAIGVPPEESAPGNRYNKDGISYLYLTSDIETSIAEIRLELDEICSIADFICNMDGIYVDVFQMKEDSLLQDLYQILMKPKYCNDRIYEITQFLSDIFKEMGFVGIVYPSTLTQGRNFVCFYPEMFSFVLYSDRVYKGVVKDSRIVPVSQLDQFKKFPDYRKEMYSFRDTEEKEEAFEYILDKIYYEDEKNYKYRCNEIFNTLPIDQETLLNQLIKDFEKTHLRKVAYQLRGTYYINIGEYQKGIWDYIVSLNRCKCQWDTLLEDVKKEIIKNVAVSEQYKGMELDEKINKTCNEYFKVCKERDKRIFSYFDKL